MRIANRTRARTIRRNRAWRATFKAAGILALVLLTAAAGIGAAYVGVQLGQDARQAAAVQSAETRSFWI